MAKSIGSMAAERLNLTRERLSLEEETRRGLELYAKASEKLAEAGERREAAEQAIQNTPSEKNSVGKRIVGTAADVVGQVAKGIARTTEGLTDGTVALTAMPVTLLVDALSDVGITDYVRDFIQYDAVGEWGGSMVDALSGWTGIDPRETSVQPETLKNIEEGVGGMLPAVAMAAIPVAGPVLSKITVGVSAGGQAMQQAYQEGAGNLEGVGYGIVSGSVELGTETMFGATSKFISKAGWLDDIVPAVAKKGVTRVAANAAEEGVEEVVSELTQPAAKTIYKGKDALKEYGTGEYWKGVGKSFVVGSGTSAVYAGTAGYGMSKAGYGHVGRAADVDALLTDIEGLKRKQQNARKHYKLTPELDAEIDTQIKNRYRDIETVLEKAKPGRRAEIIETFSLEKAVDSNGKLTADFRRRLGMDTASETAEALPRRLNPQFYKGDAERISRALDAAGREAVADADGLSATERKNYKEFLQAAETLDNVSGGTFDFVIVEPTEKSTGAYAVDEDVILISRETLQSNEKTAEALRDGWFGVTIEEALHKTAVNSNFADSYYRRFFDLMTSDKKDVNRMLGELVELGYFGDNISKARQTVHRLTHKKPENMTAAELEQRNMLYDELVAHLGRDALSTRHFYQRLIETDKNAAQRILDALRRLIKRDGKKSGKAETQINEWALLQEELFLAAVHEAGGSVNENGRIVGVNDEEEAEEERGKVRLSIKKTEDGKKFTIIDQGSIDELMGQKGETLPAKVRSFLKKYRKTILPVGSTDHAYFRREGENEYTNPAKKLDEDVFNSKMKAASEIQNILATSDYLRHETDDGRHDDAVRGWNYYHTVFVVPTEQGYRVYDGEISIKLIERGDCFYDMTKIRDITGSTDGQAFVKAAISEGDISINSISQTPPSVNPSDKKTPTIRESKKKQTPAEPSGTDRSTYELYQNVEQLVSSLMYEEAPGGAYFDGKLSERLKGTVWQRIKQAVNVGDKRYLAEKLADEILNASVIEYVAGGEMQSIAMQERNILRRYLHKLDVGAWKSDLASVFGEDGYKSLRARWGMAKKGTAMAPDSIKSELESLIGYPIEADHPAEIIEWMESKWKTVNDAITEDSKTAVSDMKGSEDYGKYRKAIADELYTKLQEIQWDAASEHLSEYYKAAYDSAWKSGKARVDAYMQEERTKLRKRDAARREREATTHWLNKAASKAVKIKQWKSAEFLAVWEGGYGFGRKRKRAVRAARAAWRWVSVPPKRENGSRFRAKS